MFVLMNVCCQVFAIAKRLNEAAEPAHINLMSATTIRFKLDHKMLNTKRPPIMRVCTLYCPAPTCCFGGQLIGAACGCQSAVQQYTGCTSVSYSRLQQKGNSWAVDSFGRPASCMHIATADYSPYICPRCINVLPGMSEAESPAAFDC